MGQENNTRKIHEGNLLFRDCFEATKLVTVILSSRFLTLKVVPGSTSASEIISTLQESSVEIHTRTYQSFTSRSFGHHLGSVNEDATP